MTTIQVWRARWRRSTARSRADNASPAYSTISAAYPSGFAGCARAGDVRKIPRMQLPLERVRGGILGLF
jgi:hypothetical protein